MPKNLRFLAKIGDSTAVSGKKETYRGAIGTYLRFLGLYLMEYGWAKKDATKPILYGAWWH